MKELYEYKVSREFIGKVGDESANYLIGAPDAMQPVLEAIGIHKDMQENFVVIYLDVRNNVTGFEKITRGLIDRSHVHPREVFRGAITANAAKVILSHNHPSGDTSPSRQDLESTKNLVEAGDIIGIKVIDHIICAERLGVYRQTSLRMNGDIG